MTLSQKALEIAQSQVGEQEHPRGSNWGVPVQTYLQSVGINFPASWCAAFLYWCHLNAADNLHIQNPMPRTGGVLDMWKKAKSKYEVTELQPGDIFIQDHGHGLGHTGIIESINDNNTLNTIEGNTNDTGSREGYEVCRKVRQKSTIIGYLRFS